MFWFGWVLAAQISRLSLVPPLSSLSQTKTNYPTLNSPSSSFLPQKPPSFSRFDFAKPLSTGIMAQSQGKEERKEQSEFVMAYCPCSSSEEAKKIATALVEEKLAACGNISSGGESVYEWENKIHIDNEVYLLLKTRSLLFQEMKERILSLHSYDIPCVVSLPIGEGHGPFLDWVRKQTKEPSSALGE